MRLRICMMIRSVSFAHSVGSSAVAIRCALSVRFSLALDKSKRTNEFIVIYKLYGIILTASPPMSRISTYTQSRTVYVVIFIYSVCTFLSFCRSSFHGIFKQRERTNEWKKIHTFFLHIFIYSISNTFSDFNTSIELVAVVNEFFTSYMRFLAFGVCVFFPLHHSLCVAACCYLFSFTHSILFTSRLKLHLVAFAVVR